MPIVMIGGIEYMFKNQNSFPLIFHPLIQLVLLFRERTLLRYLETNSKATIIQIGQIVEEELILYKTKYQFEDALSLCEQILIKLYNDTTNHPLRRAR